MLLACIDYIIRFCWQKHEQNLMMHELINFRNNQTFLLDSANFPSFSFSSKFAAIYCKFCEEFNLLQFALIWFNLHEHPIANWLEVLWKIVDSLIQ